MSLDESVLMNELFSFYSPLFTIRQKEIFNYYFLQDLSLSEIGDMQSISRQAVKDILDTVETALLKYESQLKLKCRLDTIKMMSTSSRVPLVKQIIKVLEA